MTNNDGEPLRKRIGKLTAEENEVLSSIASDDQSNKELQQLSSGKALDDLRNEALKAEHKRSERFRNLFEVLMCAAVVIAFVGVAAFGFVWLWHMLAPNRYHWLTDTQVEHIQTIFTGGVLAGLLSDHLRRRLA